MLGTETGSSWSQQLALLCRSLWSSASESTNSAKPHSEQMMRQMPKPWAYPSFSRCEGDGCWFRLGVSFVRLKWHDLQSMEVELHLEMAPAFRARNHGLFRTATCCSCCVRKSIAASSAVVLAGDPRSVALCSESVRAAAWDPHVSRDYPARGYAAHRDLLSIGTDDVFEDAVLVENPLENASPTTAPAPLMPATSVAVVWFR